MSGRATLVALGLLSVLALAYAEDVTKCYICDSASNPHCNDPLDKKAVKPEKCAPKLVNWLLNITGTYNVQCVKAVYTGKDNKKAITRACSLDNKYCEDFVVHTKEKNCFYCKSNDCNTAVTFGFTAASMALPLAALLRNSVCLW